MSGKQHPCTYNMSENSERGQGNKKERCSLQHWGFGTACLLAVMKRSGVTCPVCHLRISLKRSFQHCSRESRQTALYLTLLARRDFPDRHRAEMCVFWAGCNFEEACSRFTLWIRKMTVFSALPQQERDNWSCQVKIAHRSNKVMFYVYPGPHRGKFCDALPSRGVQWSLQW